MTGKEKQRNHYCGFVTLMESYGFGAHPSGSSSDIKACVNRITLLHGSCCLKSRREQLGKRAL